MANTTNTTPATLDPSLAAVLADVTAAVRACDPGMFGARALTWYRKARTLAGALACPVRACYVRSRWV